MKLLRFSILMAVCFICWKTTLAQETSIDLRKDGRIISGARKDFLLQRVSSYAFALRTRTSPTRLAQKFSERLHNKLMNTEVTAIVVPPGKIGEQYVIGILIGSETLPEDCIVDENDFKTLRDYSKNLLYSYLDSTYREIKQSSHNGVQVTAKINELKQQLTKQAGDKELLSLYAGYLLAELAETSNISMFADLVGMYRLEAERSVAPIVSEGIKQKELPIVKPFRFNETDAVVTFGQIMACAQCISKQQATQDSPSYIKIWQGRSLVVVPEEPTKPFDFRAENLQGYIMLRNPTIDKGAVVPLYKAKR